MVDSVASPGSPARDDNSTRLTPKLTASTPIFQLASTGDLFSTYDEYLEGVSHLSEPIWKCRLTGTPNVSYYEALRSERESLERVKDFPVRWWAPVLRLIQGSAEDIDTLGRRIAYFCGNNFVAGERVRVSLNDELYPAIIQSVINDRPSSFRVLLLSNGQLGDNEGKFSVTPPCAGAKPDSSHHGKRTSLPL